ncbi:hypothetical protein OC861_000371 [Tilletia horrida]|nr:hypothetical protein OC845_004039 [Tilletia horrida]KAK0570064.1 hypothetical protein OC861_000371 [Tilletia horrida]
MLPLLPLLLLAIQLCLPTAAVPTSAGAKRATPVVRGVNLGNHFLIEPWMATNFIQTLIKQSGSSASVSDISDEWTMGTLFNKTWLAGMINNHIDTWITDADWSAMKAAGLTHVRMPVPYYVFSDLIAQNEPYVAADRWTKLQASVLKARSYGLKVWLSLHGVPGSQNGQDSSGREGSIGWPSAQNNVDRTLSAWQRLVDEFTKSQYKGTVEVIEAVNEPKANADSSVRTLLQRYYPVVNRYLQQMNARNGNNVRFSQHDGWMGGSNPMWSNLYSADDRSKMTMDLHWYYIYGDSVNQNDTQRMQKVCTDAISKLPKTMSLYGQTVIGEFSIGSPKGFRYTAARSLPPSNAVTFSAAAQSLYPAAYLQFLSTNFRLQQQLYEQYANGWIQWTWKMDNSGWNDWSFSDGLKYGWIGDLNKNPYGANMCKTLFNIS